MHLVVMTPKNLDLSTKCRTPRRGSGLVMGNCLVIMYGAPFNKFSPSHPTTATIYQTTIDSNDFLIRIIAKSSSHKTTYCYCYAKSIFYPKLHCELNYTEYYWEALKKYTREHCKYSFPELEKTVFKRPFDALPSGVSGR